jgi:hypothetical protein
MASIVLPTLQVLPEDLNLLWSGDLSWIEGEGNETAQLTVLDGSANGATISLCLSRATMGAPPALAMQSLKTHPSRDSAV